MKGFGLQAGAETRRLGSAFPELPWDRAHLSYHLPPHSTCRPAISNRNSALLVGTRFQSRN